MAFFVNRWETNSEATADTVSSLRIRLSTNCRPLKTAFKILLLQSK